MTAQESEFANELARVARQWRTRLDAQFRGLGLTQARWRTLIELSANGPVTQRDLAGYLGVEGPTLVRLLDGLETQGLIERRPCPDDRRANLVHLTKAAGPVLDEIRGIADETRQEILAGIPTKDLSVARRVLATIAERLEKN
ncbi:MAG: MarR family transcriptional regulator [Rhodobacteraceae bacterium]|nr:MarR family transcriptional regulator [Paracoccaceae bacterium]